LFFIVEKHLIILWCINRINFPDTFFQDHHHLFCFCLFLYSCNTDKCWCNSPLQSIG
jgi:hypothetical protein